MADLSAKPRAGHCRHGFLRCPNNWLQNTLWGGDFRPLISRIFVSVSAHPFCCRYWGPCLRIQKFVPGGRVRARNPAALVAVIPRFALWSARQLFRIESERLKLSAPFGRRITEPLDADAAGQGAFYCCFDKIGREESERDGHIDLPNA